MNVKGTGAMRKGFGTLVQGFVFGLGFAVAAGGLYLAYEKATSPGTKSAQGFSAMMDDAASTSKALVLSEVEEQKGDGRVVVTGKITNNGTRSARGLQVTVDMFNHGKFVDQYSTYVTGSSLAPGEARYFKIACGCKDNPPAEHDSFKTQASSSY
jgi:hypothetical protein